MLHSHNTSLGMARDINISEICSHKEQSSQFCWICYRDEDSDHIQSPENVKPFSVSQIFRPCLCKGSMEFVHKQCLNRWVKERFTALTNSFRSNLPSSNSLPKISCPNCKSIYNYTVKQCRNYCFPTFESISSSFLETVALVILMFFQILLLFLDFRVSKDIPEPEKEVEPSSPRVSFAVQVLVGGVVVLAAVYSAFRTYTTELKVEVQNKLAFKF